MAIKVNCAELRNVSGKLAQLKAEAFEIEDCLHESTGKAAETEKEIVDQLTQICTKAFPAMIEGTCNLLNTIAADFEKMDKKFSLRPEEKIKNEVQ